jgi:hypothetical protein
MTTPGSAQPADDGQPDRFDGYGQPVFEIPEDARELDLDLQAWRREERARHRREHWERLFATRRWRRFGLSGPLVVAVLLVFASVGALMTALLPGHAAQPPARPLATPAASPGIAGGLLPLTMVEVGSRMIEVRTLRPTVLVQLPAGGCECLDQIDAIAGRAAEYALTLTLVGGVQDAGRVATLAAGVRRGQIIPAVDSGGVLSHTYGGRTVTLILVRDDGVVTGIHHLTREVASPVSLELELGHLVTSG